MKKSFDCVVSDASGTDASGSKFTCGRRDVSSKEAIAGGTRGNEFYDIRCDKISRAD